MPIRPYRSTATVLLLFAVALAGSYWRTTRPNTSSRIFVNDNESTKEAHFAKQEVWTEPEDMPGWAQKYPFMRTPEEVEVQNRICFVHVGKTAGSTMACKLGFKYDICDGEVIHLPLGNLPYYTTNLIHNMYNDCAHRDYSLFLFVVREPLARIESWFTYERVNETTHIFNENHFRQKQLLFMECPFPTLDALGGPLGLGAQNATNCSERAWQAIKGTVGYYWHNHYNYEWYYNRVLDVTHGAKPRIAVVRTEHLKDDWRRVERDILQGPAPFPDRYTFPTKHASTKTLEDSYLSKRSQANICNVLCDEIQVYKRILREAINLDESEYQASLQELVQRCPRQALADSC